MGRLVLCLLLDLLSLLSVLMINHVGNQRLGEEFGHRYPSPSAGHLGRNGCEEAWIWLAFYDVPRTRYDNVRHRGGHLIGYRDR